jgi:hypothetical protein
MYISINEYYQNGCVNLQRDSPAVHGITRERVAGEGMFGRGRTVRKRGNGAIDGKSD